MEKKTVLFCYCPCCNNFMYELNRDIGWDVIDDVVEVYAREKCPQCISEEKYGRDEDYDNMIDDYDEEDEA